MDFYLKNTVQIEFILNSLYSKYKSLTTYLIYISINSIKTNYQFQVGAKSFPSLMPM